MTNTDEKLAFSNEKAINCFILSASYVGARAMFAGNIPGFKYTIEVPLADDITVSGGGVTTYGAVMNPAIALGICLASLFNLGFEAW